MKKSDFFFIISIFLIWNILLILITYFSANIFPLQPDFLGGRISNYIGNPYFWARANFDGNYYMTIARIGYEPFTYFFFPLYPILIRFVSIFVGTSLFSHLTSGVFVSNIMFFLGMVGLYKIVKNEKNQAVAKLTIILLLIFPTSFYFGAIYTESLFFALSVWSLVYAIKRSFLPAAILAGLASGTRIIGIVLFIALVIEYFDIKFEWKLPKLKIKKDIVWLLLAPLGLAIYMGYLYLKTGDPISFFSSISIFGAQRSNHLILLPQVFYRYIFKILPNLNYDVFSVYFPAIMELAIGILFTVLSIVSFFKLRLSYAFYLTLGFLIPCLSGSFSSLPRYVLVLFPAFYLLSKYLVNKKFLCFAILSISFILLVVSFSLYARGYWIS
jgi:hypothetical protein